MLAEARTVTMERQMPHAPEKVWRALTQAPLIAYWLMENDFAPVTGHRFTFRMPPVQGWDGVVQGEVIEVVDGARLSYSWASMGVDTVVTWTLEPSAGGTLVRMEQRGFAEDQLRNYEGAKYGWQNYFGALERVLGEMA